jgi:hypothetical protein
MVVAVALGPLVLGDKEQPWKTAEYNSTHISDLIEVGGDLETGGNVQYEVKVPSPLTTSFSAGRGSPSHGGRYASVGHIYAFGNTLERYQTMILGCPARGVSGDGPFDHTTGQGWVAAQVGDYADALQKRDTVVPWIMENTGGISPVPCSVARRLGRHASAKSAIDRTKYGHSRVSTKSFYTHHTQRISAAVVRYDAQNTREQSAQPIRRALLLDADAGAA